MSDDYHNPLSGVGVKQAIDELPATGLVEPEPHHTADFRAWTGRT